MDRQELQDKHRAIGDDSRRGVTDMKEYKRIFVIVMDSLGIGAMPDSEKFGDIGVDTFGPDADTGYSESPEAWYAESAFWW